MIDYTIPVCVEYNELKGLVYYLYQFIQNTDKIVILLDIDHTNNNMLNLLDELSNNLSSNIIIGHFQYKQQYSRWIESDNELRKLCKNKIIFGLSPDEVPTIPLIQQIQILTQNNLNNFDALAVPRINIFSNLTTKNANSMYVGNRGAGYLLREPINEYGWHCWPDYQIRIYKNEPYIKYGNGLHDGFIGYKNLGLFPTSPQYSLLHVKSVEYHERMLKFYDNHQY
jgi:hypothetical protein